MERVGDGLARRATRVSTSRVLLLLLVSCAAAQAASQAAAQADKADDPDPRAHMSDEELTEHYDAEYPLIFAAGTGDVGKLTALLMKACDVRSEAACDDVNARTKEGESALHVNAIKGDGETTKVLLAYGAEVDARTPGGESPLMWAVCGGTPRHTEMVRLLLAAGADPLAADASGKTVLQAARAARAGDAEGRVVETLLLEAMHARQLGYGAAGEAGTGAGEGAGGPSRPLDDKSEL